MRFFITCLAMLILVVALLGGGYIYFADASFMPTSTTVPPEITRWWGLIEPAAAQHQVDPLLVAAVMMQESGGNPNARSWAGANGLMQVLNGPFEPQANVSLGVQMLGEHLRTFKDVRVALAAYNAGPGMSDADAQGRTRAFAGVRGAAREAGAPINQFDKYEPFLPAETRRYVPAVLAIYDRFKRGVAPVGQNMGRWPLDKFSMRPTFGKQTGNGQPWHTGEDLGAPCGTSVRAAFNGAIVYRGCLYGNCRDGGVSNGGTGHGFSVIQLIAPNRYAVYAHLENSLFNWYTITDAKLGDVIGTIGMTGWTTGCHLHFGIWEGELDGLLKGGESWLDPKKFMPPR